MTGVSTALTVCLLHALAGRKRKPEVSQPGGLRRLPGRVGEARRARVLAEHAILGVGAVAFGAQLSNTMVHDRQVRLVVVDVDVRPKAELVFVQTVDGIEETAAAIEPRSPARCLRSRSLNRLVDATLATITRPAFAASISIMRRAGSSAG
jgi:hypothetical protein